MHVRSFEIAGHHLFDHLHRFLDGLPRILPLDPVSFCRGTSARGSPSMPNAQAAFNRTRASSSHRVSIAAPRPGDPQPSQRFRRIPPRPLIIIGELFDQDFKGIGRNLSPSPGGWLFLCGTWGEKKVLAGL